MSLTEAGEIFGYWAHNPPPHLMLQTIARMLGWQPPSSSPAPPPLAEIAAAPPPGLTIARGVPSDMPAPLDLETLRARNRTRAAEAAQR